MNHRARVHGNRVKRTDHAEAARMAARAAANAAADRERADRRRMRDARARAATENDKHNEG